MFSFFLNRFRGRQSARRSRSGCGDVIDDVIVPFFWVFVLHPTPSSSRRSGFHGDASVRFFFTSHTIFSILIPHSLSLSLSFDYSLPTISLMSLRFSSMPQALAPPPWPPCPPPPPPFSPFVGVVHRLHRLHVSDRHRHHRHALCTTRK